ncbi:cytochrome c oxidase subunit II [Hyphomicrobium sp.]|uniref:cytochrome c oxidase subunit II n=1 Tax=Hyphomicrobium sp. TaxID=82 RepID=UPI002E30C8B5|nr:cytochrome c oxidase subunit II [Hyphomicrobium sp.]HEX2841166.1 cytochrome c oxidase subunit II [Hyphomicrobium sp.]
MAIALALVLVVVGSVLFHLWSPWWMTPIASNWRYIDDTILITFWITGVVFVAVILFMAYCLVRYRYRPDRQAAYEPENKKLEWGLTIATAVGVAAMLTPGLFVWNHFITVPDDAVEVEAVGQQWAWSFRLPGKDGKLGMATTNNVSDQNPLGLVSVDPNAKDDIIIQGADLHLLEGKPIKLLMRSIDVIHDFYVPEFRAKMDIVPGIVTHVWFIPTRTGTFELLCAEMCGMGHYSMRGQVVVDNAKDYQTWLDQQTTFGSTMAQAEHLKTAAVGPSQGEEHPDAARVPR